ncbi:MAG: twin-arginine translocation signal domain-containing protein [Alphaproteobacteria bacterium]|nr:twin-arginine translocation signal domain-containing protein [Alphaproteobacteria bacterium]
MSLDFLCENRENVMGTRREFLKRASAMLAGGVCGGVISLGFNELAKDVAFRLCRRMEDYKDMSDDDLRESIARVYDRDKGDVAGGIAFLTAGVSGICYECANKLPPPDENNPPEP